MSNLFLSPSYLLRGDSKGDGSQVDLVVSGEQRWSQLGVWELAWQPGHENKCVVRFTFAVCNSCFFLNESLLGNQVMKINVLAPLAFPLTSFSKPIAKFFIHIWRIWEKNAFEKRHISIYICMKFHLKRVFALLPRKEQIPSNFHLANKLGCLWRNQVFIF